MNRTRKILGDTQRILKEYKMVDGEVVRAKDGYKGYIQKSTGYIYFGIDKMPIPAHRIAFILKEGRDTLDGMCVDHKNCDQLDNSLDNLREIPRSQNDRNRKGYGRSGKVGVAFTHGKYFGTLKVDGISYNGPARESAEEAYRDRVKIMEDLGIKEHYLEEIKRNEGEQL